MAQFSDNDLYMASVGHVCLQYANLETQVAVIIWILLGLYGDEPEKGAIVVGRVDLKNRIRMALRLLDEERAPNAFRRRLKAIQTELTGSSGWIAKRNLVVHGSHFDPGTGRKLLMLGAEKSKREQAFSQQEMTELITALHRLGTEAHDLIGMIERWHRKKHGRPYTGDNLSVRKTVVAEVKFIERLNAGIQHFRRWLFG